MVRFVLVEHPRRGRIILLCTDLTMSPLDIIAGYGYRFKIEVTFRQAVHTIGSYAYHFWMRAMKPLSRRKSGNQYLHRETKEYRQQVVRKINAYHRFVQVAFISHGLLQYLALHHPTRVWAHFGSCLRTMRPHLAPSEAVVAHALRNTLLEFLLSLSPDHSLRKFLDEETEPSRAILPIAA